MPQVTNPNAPLASTAGLATDSTFPNPSKSDISLPDKPIFKDTQANTIHQDLVDTDDNILLVLSCVLSLLGLFLFLMG